MSIGAALQSSCYIKTKGRHNFSKVKSGVEGGRGYPKINHIPSNWILKNHMAKMPHWGTSQVILIYIVGYTNI